MTRPPRPAPPPALLGAEHAAAYLSISASTLRSLVAQGEAPAPVRIGARVLWRRDDLDAWVASLDPVATPGATPAPASDEAGAARHR